MGFFKVLAYIHFCFLTLHFISLFYSAQGTEVPNSHYSFSTQSHEIQAQENQPPTSKKCHLHFSTPASHRSRCSLQFRERGEALAKCRNHFTRPDSTELEIWEESHQQKCWKQNVFCSTDIYWKHCTTEAFLRQTKIIQETITYGIFHISSNLTLFCFVLTIEWTPTQGLYTGGLQNRVKKYQLKKCPDVIQPDTLACLFTPFCNVPLCEASPDVVSAWRSPLHLPLCCQNRALPKNSCCKSWG